MIHGVFTMPDGSSRQVPVKVSADGHVAIGGYDDPTDKLLIGTARERFFENFNDFDTSPSGEWEIVETGPGMTISGPLGGAAAGSGPYINIASGTTAASKTIIMSRQSFSMPLDLRYQISASQRIANNHFIIGFVQVDDAGAIVTDTTFSTELEALNARNAVYHKHDSTVATTAQLRVRAAGSALDTLANAFGTGFTTVATGTTPNFIAATTFGLTLERDRVSARAYGQNVLTNTGGQFAYDRLFLNPTRKYKLVMIVENVLAPATSTDWRIHSINLMDATRLDVSPRNGGATDGAKAFPVWVGGGTLATLSALTTITTAGTPAVPATPYILNAAAGTNAALVLTGTSGLQAFFASNHSAGVVYVKLFNKATAPVPGTDVPAMVIKVPAGEHVVVTPGFNGFRFALGLGIAITTGPEDTNSTGLATAGQVKVILSRTV